MSIYAGYKDVLVNSYEGEVKINNIPNNIKKTDIIDIARRVIMNNKNKVLTGLSNIEYIANPSFEDVDEGSIENIEYEIAKDL